MQTTSESNFFRKKYTTSVAYLVGILLFLLPFVQIKCNDMVLAQNTGIGLAFGTDYKMAGQMQNLQDGFNMNTNAAESKASKESGKMYVFALAALALGVIGLLLSLNSRNFSVSMIVGALAAIALIIVMVQVKGDVQNKLKEGNTGPSEFGNAVKASVDFTLWFYLTIVSFLAAAFFSFKKGQLSSVHTEQPPKHAPQVPIENPGEQSEFPSPPKESEIG